MKERPILFSAPMVRAILEDRKTQTRRIVKRKIVGDPKCSTSRDGKAMSALWVDDEEMFSCPYGEPGDQLWVKETFYAWGRWETRFSAKKGRDEWHFIDMTIECGKTYRYSADEALVPPRRFSGVTPTWWKRTSLFMPRWASRITLEIANVRVERVREMFHTNDLEAEGISQLLEDEDSIAGHAFNEAEHYAIAGVPMKYSPEEFGVAAFWDSINGAGSWDLNPWVWCISFEVLK